MMQRNAVYLACSCYHSASGGNTATISLISSSRPSRSELFTDGADEHEKFATSEWHNHKNRYYRKSQNWGQTDDNAVNDD